MTARSLADLVSQLAADKDADAQMIAREGTSTKSPRQAEKSTAALKERVASISRDELEAATPLLSLSVDPELRLSVLQKFAALDPEGSAELLIAHAESNRASPGGGLASGLVALTFTLENFGQYSAGLKALHTAFTSHKARLRALARPLVKFQKAGLERGIATLGLDASDLKRLRTSLKKGSPSAIDTLKAALLPPDPLLPELAVEVLHYVNNKSHGPVARDYADGLYVLSSIAGVADMSAGIFIDALKKHPGTNEAEYAMTGLRRIASRLHQKGNRAGFEAVRGMLKDLTPPVTALENHFASLNWE